MRWSTLSLMVGTGVLLLAFYLRSQPAPSGIAEMGPEIDSAAKPDEANLLGDLAPVQVKRQYAFRIESDRDRSAGKLVLTEREGADGYSTFWDFGDAYAWDGIAQPSDGFLAMATSRFPLEYPRFDDVFGLAIYRIKGGRLIGRAIEERRTSRRQFVETLTGPATLSGRYEIESGGAGWRKGSVQITAKKGRYLFARIGDHPVMTGVGVKLGDLLFVSYASRVSPWLVAVCRTPEGLRGILVDATLKTSRIRLTEPSRAPVSGGGAEHGCQELLDQIADP